MKWFWRSIWTMLLGAIGTLLIGTFQDRVIELFHGNDLIADVYTAPWQPLPKTEQSRNLRSRVKGPLDDTPLEMYSESVLKLGDMPLVMIRLKNNGIRDASDVRLQLDSVGNSFGFFKRPNEQKDAATVISELNNVQIGSLEAGKEIFIYFWLPYSYDLIYSLAQLRIFSPEKAFAIQIHKYKNFAYKYENVPRILILFNDYGTYIFIILISLITFASLGLHFYFAAYVQKLFGSEDFYLTERIRFETEGKNWQPDLSDLKL